MKSKSKKKFKIKGSKKSLYIPYDAMIFVLIFFLLLVVFFLTRWICASRAPKDEFSATQTIINQRSCSFFNIEDKRGEYYEKLRNSFAGGWLVALDPPELVHSADRCT